jgi:ABC-type spermidine/putrescine transport system permease subunit I
MMAAITTHFTLTLAVPFSATMAHSPRRRVKLTPCSSSLLPLLTEDITRTNGCSWSSVAASAMGAHPV